jgi:hypothetical protein
MSDLEQKKQRILSKFKDENTLLLTSILHKDEKNDIWALVYSNSDNLREENKYLIKITKNLISDIDEKTFSDTQIRIFGLTVSVKDQRNLWNLSINYSRRCLIKLNIKIDSLMMKKKLGLTPKIMRLVNRMPLGLDGKTIKSKSDLEYLCVSDNDLEEEISVYHPSGEILDKERQENILLLKEIGFIHSNDFYISFDGGEIFLKRPVGCAYGDYILDRKKFRNSNNFLVNDVITSCEIMNITRISKLEFDKLSMN